MKRFILFGMTICLIFSVCACTFADNSDVSDVADVSYNKEQYEGEETLNVETLIAPDTFKSFDEFEQHEQKERTKTVSCYYIPTSVPMNFELAQITKRDDVYVMVEYRLVSTNAVSVEGLSEYDAGRLQTLICRYSLYSDGEKALEENFINEGYEAIEYEGRTYYRWDEHAENNPEKQVLGYEIAFLDEGNLIFFHLPAVGTFEYMMQYADVTKVNIN